jgi:hypothetical protein
MESTKNAWIEAAMALLDSVRTAKVYYLVVLRDAASCIILSFWRSGPARQYVAPVTL